MQRDPHACALLMPVKARMRFIDADKGGHPAKGTRMPRRGRVCRATRYGLAGPGSAARNQ